MKKYLTSLFLFLLLLSSCRPEALNSGVSAVIPATPAALDSLLSDADSGSFSALNTVGEKGGDGAWFALAAAADIRGFSELARTLRLRSAEEDSEPFRSRSLVRLLISDPAAVPRPLRALRRAEKRIGQSEELRQAEISVLAFEGKDRELAEQINEFRGESWEAPVLAAVLRQGAESPETHAIVERFILHSPEPASLVPLAADLPGSLDLRYRRLLEARISFSKGEIEEALDAYADWLHGLNASGEACDYESPPPVYAEITEAAVSGDQVELWASLLAETPRYGALYQAGRLYRNIDLYKDASSVLLAAAGSVPGGLDRDRAIWLRLRVMYQDFSLSIEDELEAIYWASGVWENPERFDDRLSEFLHRRVRRGEWTILERVYRDLAADWPASVRSRAAWVLAFATVEGRTEGDLTPRRYLEESLESAPLDWSGLRAAAILDRGFPQVSAEPDPHQGLSTPDDMELELYLKWGLIRPAADLVLENPDLYSDHVVRSTARALAADYPRISIRIAGILWYREGFTATREDLLLRYPLPYGSLAADIASERNLPPEIFLGLIRTESAWDAGALSRSGAQGLAQFMPATWEEWVRRLRYPEDSDPLDPETNLELGAAYLEWLNFREWTFGWTDVLASYNAGGGRIRTWRNQRPGLGDDLFGMSIPIEEPRSYIRKVLSAGTVYGYLYAGKSPRSLQEEWGFEMIEVN